MKISMLLLIAICLSPQVAWSQKKTVPVGVKSFRGVAQIQKLSVKSKGLEAEAFYPTFRARTPLLRFVNAQMRRETRADYNDWLQKHRPSLAASPGLAAPYDYSVTPTLLRLRPAKLVAMRVDAYQYTGGAHGMFFSLPTNFGMVDNRPKRLVLGDLFRAGTPYRAQVEAKIFSKLRQNPGAMWVADKSVKTLTTEQFNNFEMRTDGLNWIFNAYEMGPYANGQIEVHLSPAELGSNFKREWLQ